MWQMPAPQVSESQVDSVFLKSHKGDSHLLEILKDLLKPSEFEHISESRRQTTAMRKQYPIPKDAHPHFHKELPLIAV